MNSWIIENLGWTLLHSLWQFGFIGLILFSALRIFKDFSANVRYLLSVSALSLSFLLPLLTFFYFSTATNSPQPIKQTVSAVSKSDQTQEPKNQTISETIDVPRIVSADNLVASPSPNIPFLPILVGFWLIGVFIFSIRLMGGVWTVHLYKTRKTSAVETHWQEKFDEFCESLQIQRKVRFLQSKLVEIPVVIGWLKPVVLVPASAFLQISPKELETILIHELTHIKRHDYLVNFLQSLVEILFFYHPGIWWISSQIKTEREFAVDEFVSQTFETERFIYANALANLEEIRLANAQTTPNLAMAGTGGNLMKRIENILQENKKINSKNVSIWSAVFAVTLMLGLTVGGYWFKTEENVKTKKGRKVAIIFSDFSDKKQQDKSYQNLVELQNKLNIPATWILDSNLIEALKQNESTKNFFRQAKENRSNFIVYVPNISYTIFMNGDDEYIEAWKKRLEFVEGNLANNGDKLKYYSIGSSGQIPQEMENTLTKKGLKQVKVPNLLDSRYKFDFIYEKDCGVVEGKYSCKDQSAEKQKEIREKYLQYVNEIFELNEQYSQEKFGVVMPQVLTLRGDGLTKDSADELLQILQDKGYEFVPLEEVTSNEIFKKLQTPSRENADFRQRKWRAIDKYVEREFPVPTKSTDELKRAMENLNKSFNVKVTTKDLKVKPQ